MKPYTHLLETRLWLFDTYEFVGKSEANYEILGPFQGKLFRIAPNGPLRSPLELGEMADNLKKFRFPR